LAQVLVVGYLVELDVWHLCKRNRSFGVIGVVKSNLCEVILDAHRRNERILENKKLRVGDVGLGHILCAPVVLCTGIFLYLAHLFIFEK